MFNKWIVSLKQIPDNNCVLQTLLAEVELYILDDVIQYLEC